MEYKNCYGVDGIMIGRGAIGYPWIFNGIRRHYANYLKGLPNIKEYRNKLVRLTTEEEIIEVLNEIESVYAGFEMEKHLSN